MKRVILVFILVAGVLSCGENEENTGESTGSATQETVGERLFNTYCTQCHSLNENRIGPALKGSFAKWDYDTARISSFIRNARESINSGDPRAVAVAEEYNYALMTPMPQLDDEDIKHLLEYMAE